MKILRAIFSLIKKFDIWFSRTFSWFFTNGNKIDIYKFKK